MKLASPKESAKMKSDWSEALDRLDKVLAAQAIANRRSASG
jgi:hypothetical protein